MESLRLDCKKIKAMCIMCVRRVEVWVFVHCYCSRFVYFWLFSALEDTPWTTLSGISISRKGQCNCNAVWGSGDLLCPNQSAQSVGPGSESHSDNVSALHRHCLVSVWQVTKADGLDLRSFQDQSLREYGKAGERNSGYCCVLFSWWHDCSLSLCQFLVFLPEGLAYVTVLIMF